MPFPTADAQTVNTNRNGHSILRASQTTTACVVY